MNNWTTIETEWLIRHLSFTPTEIYNLFCEEFGDYRSYNSIQKKISRLNDLLETDNHVYNTSVPEKQTTKQDATEWAESVISSFKKLWSPDKKAYTYSKTNNSLVLLLSDNHFGKHTPIFNMNIARKRIESIPQNLSSVINNNDVDEIVIVLAGDMIEGEDIYPTQSHHLECPVIEQVQTAAEAYWWLTLDVLERFPQCTVRMVTCPGNHGRVSHKANPKSNWDNIVYQELGILSKLYKFMKGQHSDRLTTEINLDPFYRFDVKGRSILTYHHGVKHTGTPAMQTKLAGWNEIFGFELLAHGHWHKWEVGTQFGKVIVKNGSLCGIDDYTQELGYCDPPRQAYWLVNANKGFHGFSYIEW